MKEKISRREFLRTVAVGGAAAGLAACAPSTVEVIKTVEVPGQEVVKTVEVQVTQAVKETVEVVKTVEVPVYQGGLPTPRSDTLVLDESATYYVFDKTNPFIPNGSITSGWDQLIGARLMYLDWASGKDVNFLVEGYQYNSDFTQITFKTRKEAMWNDGQPFTAKDIKFTIEMLKAHDTLTYAADMIHWVDSVDTPDDYTAVIKLTAANARFHWLFKQAWSTPIVAEHEWTGKDPTTYAAFPPIGTGSYKWHSAVPELRMYVFEKVENWWGSALGYQPVMPYIIWQTSAPPEAELQDLVDNYIDHAHGFTSDANLLHQAQKLNPEVVLAPWRDPCPRGIFFNCSKYPLSKPEVRWAMFHCVDKKKAATSLYPWPTVPAAYPWADWGSHDKYDYKDILTKYDADPETSFDTAKGAKILDDLGFKAGADGVRVDDKGNKMEYTIIVPQQAVTGEYPIALDFADNLAKIGIKATVKWNEYPVFEEAYQTGNFDITSHWWCGNWQEPPMTFADYKIANIAPIGTRNTSAGNQWSRLSDPDLDKLAVQLDATNPDDPKTADVFKAAFEAWLKLMPSIPVIQTTYVMPFGTHYWKGFPQEGKITATPFTWWAEFQFTLYGLTKA